MKMIATLPSLPFFFLLALCLPAPVHAARAVPETQTQVQLSYAPIVKKTAPAVVNIYTRKLVQQRVYSPFLNDPFFQHFFGGGLPQGMTRQRLENSLGSGVLVSADGLIVTSNHVIAGADEITVVLSDRREFEATIVSTDERSDIAVLRVNAKGLALPFLTLMDSDQIEVGDMVLAIGNPFGVGQTVTSGIVSALARTTLDINDINYYIQTDAAINPGNSGGALVGMDGSLMGINTAIYSKSGGNMGLGFAVPSNMVRAVIQSADGAALGGKIKRPWTGIAGQSVTADVAASLGMERPRGFLVKGLHKASPLAQKLKKGDVILSVNGREVEDFAAFNYRIATIAIGSAVELNVWRGGQSETLRFKLIAPPEVPARGEILIEGRKMLSGAKIANLSPALAEEMGLREAEEGVVVTGIARGSLAQDIGLRRGDVLLAINEAEITRTRDVEALIAKPAPGWRLSIGREGRILNLLVR